MGGDTKEGGGAYLFHDGHRPRGHGHHRGDSSCVMALSTQPDDLLQDVHSCGVKPVTL